MMSLRQIIRNQKLSNFNLRSLIKEASDYEEYVSQSMPGIGNKDVRISSVLNYKTHKDFKSHPKKAQLYNQALYNLQQGIEDGSVKLSGVPEEFRKEGLKRKSPEPKKEPTAEPEKEPSAKDFDDELADLQDFMAAQPMPGEDEDKPGINSEEVIEKADEIEKRENDLINLNLLY